MAGMEERVAAVEQRADALEEKFDKVAQARLINGQLLRSLRDTQIEHSRKLDKLQDDVLELKLGQQSIAHTLTTLIDRE